MIGALEILHVAAAAAWFGQSFLAPRDLSDSVLDPAGSIGFISRMGRMRRLGLAAGLLTLASGLGLMHLTTGLLDAPLRIYLGLGAVVAIFVVDLFVAGPGWRQVRRGLESDDHTTAAAAVPRFRQTLLLHDLLWILALGSMIVSW